MAKCLILVGALLLSPTAWAQTGSVRIRVTDVSGHLVPGATVSLYNNWNRKIGTLSADRTGEILWPRLPFAEWRFTVVAPGFAPDAFALNICESHKQMIRVELPAAPPDRDLNIVTVEASAMLLKLEPMPYCNVLNLPQPPKPK